MSRPIAALALATLLLFAPGAEAVPRHTDPLAWRGIVEGSYGRPWTHAERIDVLRWMAAHGMNAYVHAPKDDPWQRAGWRDPYPEAIEREFAREIRFARRHGIEWVPSLSPAMPLIPTLAGGGGPPSRDLCFSCPSDLEATAAKLEPFLAAGSRAVMISFDDVTKLITHPEDFVAFGVGDRAFGEANGTFLTRLRARLRRERPRVRVLTVGADYSGVRGTRYLEGLRSTLAPGIEVLWTGTSVPSEHWSAADARDYAHQIGRKPVVWENWTNNDTAGNAIPAIGATRIFLGPYTRDPAAARAVRGFLFNPANEAYLNLLPLATAAAWMESPRRYRPRRAWRRAVRELAPGRGERAKRRRHALRAWAEANWSNKLDREREAPTFSRHAARFIGAYRAGGGWPRHFTRLVRELRLVEGAPRALRRLPRYPELGDQAREFLDSAAKMARAGRLAAELLGAERPSLEILSGVACPTGPEAGCSRASMTGRAAAPDPSRAAGLRSALGSAATTALLETEFAYGWRLGLAIELPPYAVPRNVIDEFVGTARSLDLAWQLRASRAASAVSVTLDGRPVALGEGGAFRLRGRACGLLEATDGAGDRTARRIPCTGPNKRRPEARPTPSRRTRATAPVPRRESD